jgi:dienelactone hydrolase
MTTQQTAIAMLALALPAGCANTTTRAASGPARAATASGAPEAAADRAAPTPAPAAPITSAPPAAPGGATSDAAIAGRPGADAAFDERDLVIGDYALPATLTVPRGAGPWPVVVLVHGSGPHDRDETLGPNKPFRDLAVGLASRGIASLRYDKRTFARREAFAAGGTYTVEQEVLADARAAVALMATTQAIDPRRIYVLGHSWGGTLAPRIAAREPRVAGLVLLAGATRSLDQIVPDQIKTAAPGNAELAAKAARFAEAFRSPTLAPADHVDLLGAKIPGSYVLDLRSYDPAASAAALTIPLLVLRGERDYQVTDADLDGWRRALAGHRNATFKTYPGLNHLFMPGSGPPSPADYLRAGEVEPAVLDDIAHWLLAQSAAP